MTCACPDCGEILCSCCVGVTRETPVAIVNPPLAPAVAYRVGTYSSFYQTMLAALSSSSRPGLAGLRTRDSSDFSIALTDAWACTLDTLTFYTERLANEAWLGTAIEGRSVFELAALVGYRPSPGVDAATVLAFTLSSAPGSPASVDIPAGTRVQSVPGPGQQPQIFETSRDFNATVAANAIAAATVTPASLAAGAHSCWIAGIANAIKPGDLLLFIAAPAGSPSPGQGAAIAFVTALQTDPPSGDSQLFWDRPLPASVAGAAADVALYVMRAKAALFGVSAMAPGIFPWKTLKNIPGHPSLPITSASDWIFAYGGNQTVSLDAVYAGLNPTTGAAGPGQWAVFANASETALFQIAGVSESNPAAYALSAKTTQLTVAKAATPLSGSSSTSADALLSDFVAKTRSTTVYLQSRALTLADAPLTAWEQSANYPLSGGMLAPVSGAAVKVDGLWPLGPNSPIGVSGARLRIATTGAGALFTPSGASKGLTVSANQAFLIDAFPPASDTKSSNLLWSVLTVTGQPGILSVAPGGFVLQPSVSADPPAGEAAVAASAAVDGAATTFKLLVPLARIYDSSTFAVNANAVAATQGETTQEILGSGDATSPALTLQLKQSPLTYTPAANANGVQSSLQVRVNTLLWQEVDDFLESGPADRVYVTESNATGGPNVIFGDGVNGALTATGVSNVTALYRVGIGSAGNVGAGQLTQPLDRPQGLQSVTNPSAANGGEDPATPDQARQMAPLPTLTLGRVVSLEDYQNFSLNIPGIALALASWAWFGARRGVLLTVAGAGGAVVGPVDLVVQNLLLALAECGQPCVPVRAVSYTPVLFEVALQVRVDTPLYVGTAVVAQVWQALTAAFAFGQLAPGQGVAASQIVELAQQIPGVLGVKLSGFNRSGVGGLNEFLCAAGPRPSLKPPQGAEVLLLDPACQGNVEAWA